jgi:hypothetical protein
LSGEKASRVEGKERTWDKKVVHDQVSSVAAVSPENEKTSFL